MSDTPRTDAVAKYGPAGSWAEEIKIVNADFARTLERENAALREALLPFAKMHCNDATCDCHNCRSHKLLQ